MITLKELCLKYKHDNWVLDKINLEIPSGTIYGLLGKNGVGKTTLLRIISGLVFADEGMCMIDGEDVTKRKANILQKIFFLPEEIILPDVTCGEYIKIYAPFYPTFEKEILNKCIESFQIDLASRLRNVSQGQRKKIAISLALAVHTPVLLMDEPTNGLDIPSKIIFRKLIASYTGENQTVIISTHQVRDLENLIDSVLILNNKQILLHANLSEIENKLFFRQVSTNEMCLFSVDTPYGLLGVGKNVNKEITPVSLELLFNAAILHPGEIKEMFN